MTTTTPNEIARSMQGYFESEALSQSFLKKLAGTREQEDRESPALNFGHLFDVLCTNKDAFDELFWINDGVEAPEKIVQLCEKLWEIHETRASTMELEDFDREQLTGLARGLNYRGNIKDENKFYNKILEEGSAYWDLFVKLKTDSRRVITSADHDLAMDMEGKLRGRFPALWELPHDDQVHIEWEHQGYRCKALIDRVVRNDSNSEVKICDNLILFPGQMLPVDFKSTRRHPIHFKYDIRDYRYDIQAAWYEFGLNEYMSDQEQARSWDVQPFVFAVESKTSPGYPLLWQLQEHDYSVAWSGGNYVNGRVLPSTIKTWDYRAHVPGILQYLDLYRQMKESGEFFLPMLGREGCVKLEIY